MMISNKLDMNRLINTTLITVLLYFTCDFIKMYIEYYKAFDEYNANIKNIRNNRLVSYFFQEPEMITMPHDIICMFFIIPLIIPTPFIILALGLLTP